jgi:phosphate transport system substrate-binding protein
MKNISISAFLILILTISGVQAQKLTDNPGMEFNETVATTEVKTTASETKRKVVVVTGTRFAYPLVQKWIDTYNEAHPDVQIIIEARGSADPQYDILIEAYEQPEEVKEKREYVYIARYAILPVANDKSAFAKTYAAKGLNRALINQLYFHDLFADTEKEIKIKEPFTIYTRLQKAGAPIAFTKFFGFEQKDIKGKAIAGADEHLLKAIIRDSTAVSYLPLALAYDHTTSKQASGITVLPVDLNGNDKVSDEEKIYSDIPTVISKIESAESKELRNLPIEYLHLSVDKKNATPEAVAFLKWVMENGSKDLHAFGYLLPQTTKKEKEKFEQFANGRSK